MGATRAVGRRARRWWFVAAAAVACSWGARAGCSERAETGPPPPPVVTVVEARRADVPVRVSPNGTTRALKAVSIRARVRGFLREQHFEEGADVKAGQLLFVIEEDPYRAQLDAAKARLDEAKAALEKAKQSKAREVAAAQLELDLAQLQLAQVEEKRQRLLFQRNATSRENVDQAEANRKKYAAQVEADRANLEQAKADYEVNIHAAEASVAAARAAVLTSEIDLSYCRMSAPIDGRIGEAKVKVGNLVGSAASGGGDATELATIQQLDPMGVDIQASSRYLERATQLIRKGLPVRLIRPGFEGEQNYPHVGEAFFIDNTVDPTTSTFLVKARVPNPEKSLLPGEYVRVLMTVEHLSGVVVVPERAVVETQSGPTVFVVDRSSKVVVARVDAGDTIDGMRVVRSGLEAGQKVIVEGLQMVRPGMTVKAEPAAPDATTPTPTATASAARPGGG